MYLKAEAAALYEIKERGTRGFSMAELQTKLSDEGFKIPEVQEAVARLHGRGDVFYQHGMFTPTQNKFDEPPQKHV